MLSSSCFFSARAALLAGVATAALRLPAVAETAQPVVDLPEITIVTTGDPVPTSHVGSSVTVVTADQIEKEQRRTINDVLETVPGLNVVQTGGPGGLTSVFMRGTASDHVKVLIDGIDVGNPSSTNGAFDFGQLLTGDIARVEVLRGPQSGFYGSDAIGGVISITTKKGSGPPKVTATVEGGSFGTLNEKLGLSGSSSIFNYAFNLDHFRSVATPVVPAYYLPPSQKAADQFYDNYSFSSRVGADLTPNLSINSVFRYTDATLLANSDFNCAFAPPYYCYAFPDRDAQRTYNLYTREEAVWRSLDDRFRTTLGVNYTDERSKDTFPPDYYDSPETYTGQRLQYNLKQEIGLIPGEKLILGAETQRETLDNTGTSLEVTKHSRDSVGVYGELESNPFKNFFVASNLRYDDYQTFGGHVTYRIAPSYTIEPTGTVLKASVGSGFKAPTLDELYDNYAFGGGYYFYANPNLKPETSTGWDAGFEQPFLDNRVHVGATYFENHLNNLIADNASYTSYVNIASAKTYGVESFASYKFNDVFSIRADYTYTMVRDLTENDPDDASLRERRPAHKASLKATWTPMDKLHLSTTLLYVSSWLDYDGMTSTAMAPVKGYETVNVSGSYDINAQTTVFARIDNLFNRHYENPLGYLQPGIGAYAGVKVTSF